MKHLSTYILEKFKINKNTKIEDYLDPTEFTQLETPGKDYFGEDVTIIGFPFKTKQDDNYKKSKEYIKKKGYSIWYDLEDFEDKDMFEWFVYAGKLKEQPNTIDCYSYGPEGVVAIKEK